MPVLATLFDARRSALLFIAALLGLYASIPLLVESLLATTYFSLLAQICIVACIGIIIGFAAPLVDSRFVLGAKRISVNSLLCHCAVWGLFVVLFVMIIATADSVPFVSAIKGTSAQGLSEQRAALLKTRTGWQATWNYASALLTSSLAPYSLAVLFLERARLRWVAFAFFLVYCEASLEKVLFLKVAVPLLYLAAHRKIWSVGGALAMILGCLGLIYLNTVLSRGQEPETLKLQQALPGEVCLNAPRETTSRPDRLSTELCQSMIAKSTKSTTTKLARSKIGILEPDFFTPRYEPNNAFDHILWRSIAVPVFTAADALRVFDIKYHGELLWGATSTLLAVIMNHERVPFEAVVHGFQWGSGEASPTGRSNSVFFTEAFVNFGWVGVALFSFFVGQSLRWFRESHDDAFKSIWPLYAFSLFSTALMPNLLSNGMAVLFFIGLFVKLSPLATSAVRNPAMARISNKPSI